MHQLDSSFSWSAPPAQASQLNFGPVLPSSGQALNFIVYIILPIGGALVEAIV